MEPRELLTHYVELAVLLRRREGASEVDAESGRDGVVGPERRRQVRHQVHDRQVGEVARPGGWNVKGNALQRWNHELLHYIESTVSLICHTGSCLARASNLGNW